MIASLGNVAKSIQIWCIRYLKKYTIACEAKLLTEGVLFWLFAYHYITFEAKLSQR